MQFSLNNAAVQGIETPCLVIGIVENEALSPAAAAIDVASGGELQRMLDNRDIAVGIG